MCRFLDLSINVKILKQKCEEFKKIEDRASFYDIAGEISKDHPIQAAIIILATWGSVKSSVDPWAHAEADP
jgi:hypothetical protein